MHVVHVVWAQHHDVSVRFATVDTILVLFDCM